MKVATRMKLRVAAVWFCRLLVGCVFMVSGWAKSVDPAGFIIKVGEYLAAWNLSVPHEAIVAGCMALSAIEFAVGALTFVGSLKRVTIWCATVLMAFMLPLTLYIAIANPVADCGCFGDFIKLSNWATFAKNVVISAAVIYLLFFNRAVRGFYPNPVQWIVTTVSLGFPMVLGFIGYHIQPVVDFRPFPIGSNIFHTAPADEGDAEFIYERNGERQVFGLDELPDSTWTYVEAIENNSDQGADIAVRDDNGDDVSIDIVDLESPQVWLVIPDPRLIFLSYSHQISELQRWLDKRDIDFTAIVGSHGAGYNYWIDLIHPTFPVYSAEDTALEQLVRGNASLVYTRGGVIVWKLTLSSVAGELPDENSTDDDLLDRIRPVDDGRIALITALVYLGLMLALSLLGQSPKLLRLITYRKPTTPKTTGEN